MRDLKTLRKMIFQLSAILDRKQIIKMIIVLVIILIGSVFELLGVSAILPFIQSMLTPEKLIEKPYMHILSVFFNIYGKSGLILIVGFGIIVIYLLKNIYLSFSAYIQASYGNSTQKELSVLMFKSYLNRPYSFFMETGSGDILRGVNSDTTGVYNVITNGFKLAAEGFTVVAIAFYLVMIDLWMALGVLLVGILCMVWIILVLKKRIASYARIFRETSATRNRWLVQAVSGIKDIKVFNRMDYFIEGFDEESRKYAESNTKYTFASALPERLIEALCVSGIIMVVLIRFMIGVNIDTFVTKMAVFAMGAFRILPSIARTTGYINGMVYYRPMVESTYENIISAKEYSKRLKTEESYADGGEKMQFNDKIELTELSWKYPEGKKKVLDDLNMCIKKGQVIGIVGESGSGKTTLADILLKLFIPQNGMITLDGKDIRSISASDWTGILSYVPQNVFMIDDTVRTNIVFGREYNGDDAIWEVLKKASLDEFIKNLPKGLDTVVGERGMKFSGGQRQRIAIARALYSNPQLLVLDEATSALDNETENAVMEAIDALAGNITMIIIAHRLTTLKGCDKIFEISHGKAIEREKDDIVTTKM